MHSWWARPSCGPKTPAPHWLRCSVEGAGRMPTPGKAELRAGDPERLARWEPENWPLAEGWRPVVDAFLASEDGRRLASFLQDRLAAGALIYPPRPFRALEITPLPGVRAVVLGQDPYHG